MNKEIMLTMKISTGTLAVLVASLGFASTSQAALIEYSFVDSDNGGTTSATMVFDDSQFDTDSLTIVLNNVSPIFLDSGTGGNAPGISAFGFNLANAFDGTNINFDNVTGRSLMATNSSGVQENIADLWVLTDFEQGLRLDLIAENGNGVTDALYNPACLTDPTCAAGLPGGSNQNFFTTATLTLEFNVDVTPTFNLGQGNTTASPLVRMQNVGTDGKGSTKTGGTHTPVPPTQVPEPGSLLLLGAGFIGLAAVRRRKRSA